MKVKGIIKIIDDTREGVSERTGNPWKSKNIVIETAEDVGNNSTLACSTINIDVIRKLEAYEVGDAIELDLRFWAQGKRCLFRDQTQGWIRSTDVSIYDVAEKPL